MKLSTAVFFIAILGGASWYGYTRWYTKLSPILEAPSQPVFPVERTLRDKTGRTVAARLLARNATQVRFVRTSDGQTYDYPISSLADEDQQFVRQYPESILAPLVVAPSPSPSESQVTARLRRERAELEHKIGLMDLELRKTDNKSPVLPRDETIRRINADRNRIIDIDKELREIAFRSRNP